MKFIWKSNVNKFIASLLTDKIQILNRIKRGMKQGMRLFGARMIKEQMSGRKNPMLGLWRQDGHLARSWDPREEGAGGLDYRVRWATRTPYAIYHQTGTQHVPQRLYIYEEFKRIGFTIIQKRVSDLLAAYLV